MFKNIKKLLTKNNLFIISFFIFISIPIIIAISLATDKKWYDTMSILSVFYVGIPILILIYTMNEKGLIRKSLELFKFKETKELRRKKLSSLEEEKLKVLNIETNIKEKKTIKNKNDIIFISLILITYGLLLLISSVPSLIIFTIK